MYVLRIIYKRIFADILKWAWGHLFAHTTKGIQYYFSTLPI